MLMGFDISELLCMTIFDDISEEGTNKVWIIGIEQQKDRSFVYTTFEIEDNKVLHANSYITFKQLRKGNDGPLFQFVFKYEFFDKILYNGNFIILAEIVVDELYQMQE